MASLVGLLALSGLLAQGASAAGTPATILLASGTTPATFAIGGGASGTAVSQCRNVNWNIIPTTSWIGVSPDCTVGNAASNKTTTYTVTFTLPAGYTAPSISGSALLADNVGSVTLNGTMLAGGAVYYLAPVPFNTNNAALFHVGVNTLVFTVTDTGGPNGLDYAATVNFTQPADLGITKTAAPTTVLHGQNVVYTLTVTNAGPGTASAPVITDTLPAGQTLVFADTFCTTVGNPVVVTCPTADLPSGSSVTIHLTASTAGIAAPLTGPLAQTNTASVASSTGDPDLSDNTAHADITVVPAADLSLVKKSTPNPVIAGQQLTYTLTTTNAGPDTAVNARVVDTLPMGQTLLNEGPQPNGQNCTAVGQVVTCTLGDIPAGGVRTVTLVVAVTATPPPGSVDNSATVSSDTADPNLMNNTSTVTTGVTPNCTTTISGRHVGAIDVKPGQFLCLVNATQIGGILVDAGGALTATNSTIQGGVQSNGAVFMTLCGNTLSSGSIVIKNTTLLTRVGDDDAINCAGNHVAGSVTLTGNTGGAEVFGNTIRGSLSVDNNAGASLFADATPEIEGNTVGGGLDCSANTPPPINEGSVNTVTGAKLGQCASL